jgi:hypothetical protein
MEPPYVRLWATSLEQFRRHAGPDMYDKLNFTCHFYFDNSTTAEVQGRIIHAEAPDMAEEQFILLCPGKSLVQFGYPVVAPTGVRIGCDTCHKGWIFEVRWDSKHTRLPLMSIVTLLAHSQLDGRDGLALMNGEKSLAREKLVVCYKPWYGPADDALPLVESLIFYSTMGATHFVFLNNRGITPMMVRSQAKNTLSPRHSITLCHSLSLSGALSRPPGLCCPSPLSIFLALAHPDFPSVPCSPSSSLCFKPSLCLALAVSVV